LIEFIKHFIVFVIKRRKVSHLLQNLSSIHTLRNRTRVQWTLVWIGERGSTNGQPGNKGIVFTQFWSVLAVEQNFKVFLQIVDSSLSNLINEMKQVKIRSKHVM